MTDDARDDRLDSWKEIATYLERSVRTVRRWEKQEGLPVHRHMHSSLGSVYAYRTEIEQWRRRNENAPGTALPSPQDEPAERSVGVVPFSYLGPRPEDDFFADGVTEEVIIHLSRLRLLRVISRTSSMALKGTEKDVRTIGRELGVRYVVEGTVRRDGERLKIAARLIDADADDRLWSETFESAVPDMFSVQETIARRIAEALEVRITREEDRMLAGRPLGNVVAWECLVQARREALRWRRDSIERAITLLHEGLSLVGDSAELYAALGKTHLQLREAGIDLTDAPLEMADRYAAKALALDPDSPAGHQLRGWSLYSRGGVEEAVRELELSLERDWSNADTLALLSNCYLISGRVPTARRFIDRLLAIDPLTPLTRCMPGWADALEGKFAAAIEPYRAMLAMDPGNPMARLFYAYILMLNDRRDDVETVVEQFPDELRGSLPGVVARALALAMREDAADQLRRISASDLALETSTELFPRMLAQAHARAGMGEDAVRWLSIAVDRGFINHPFLANHDRSFDPIRRDEAFRALLDRTRERWEAFDPSARTIASGSGPRSSSTMPR